MTSIKPALKIGTLMALQYCLLCLNMRAVAAGSYPGTIASDVFIAMNGFVLVRSTVAATTLAERIAYIVGGCVGSVIALWLTR